MLAYPLKTLTNTFIILACCSLPSFAADPESGSGSVFGSLSSGKTAAPLPLGTLLDSDGKPLPIPAEQSALDYAAPAITPDFNSDFNSDDSAKTKAHNKSAANHKKKKLNRKQQLASRENVANDPSCRWLDTRMSQLETQIGNKRDKAADHQNAELSARQQEWQCLKCSIEGPAPEDYHRCQYRR